MLIVIYGATATERKNTVKKILLKKFPKTALQFHVIEIFPSLSELQTRAHQSNSFFNEKQIVLLKDMAHELVEEYSKTIWNMLNESDTVFFLLDESHLRTALLEVKESGAEIFELKKRTEKKNSTFNAFAICNAFSRKNKFRVWQELLISMSLHEQPEAVVGRLFSRLRSMLAEGQYEPYSKNEVERLSASLALLLPQTRIQGKDSMLALESWVLQLPE
ncbi:MAG: hypothetical protein KBB88_00805 [Candidatus Pacebacteria bacterium]|nr:hypothetical protein [Candidatus Paceibacterota bacterium]